MGTSRTAEANLRESPGIFISGDFPIRLLDLSEPHLLMEHDSRPQAPKLTWWFVCVCGGGRFSYSPGQKCKLQAGHSELTHQLRALSFSFAEFCSSLQPARQLRWTRWQCSVVGKQSPVTASFNVLSPNASRLQRYESMCVHAAYMQEHLCACMCENMASVKACRHASVFKNYSKGSTQLLLWDLKLGMIFVWVKPICK